MRPSLGLFVFSVLATTAFAQTTSGTSATIVVPVIAQTSSFGSEMTVYNPNAATITVNPVFYDAQNTASPGAKSCTSLSVGANVSRAFTVASQCALPSGSNFGLLVLSESTGTNRFYGYARTQTPQGVGFSTEGFPIENFNDQIQHAIGLKRVAAAAGLPAFQTNCFVATLGDAVSYELRLFNGSTNTQLGSTLSGSLAAFQQFRYLDVFAAAGVAAGNKSNVRAQFTNLTGNSKKLIGFCTVQENTSLSADFRIAKSYGGTPQNAFVQGGNAFGTTALLGTIDNQPLTVLVNDQPVMRYLPTAGSPNVLGGHLNNSVGVAAGNTVAGGGAAGSGCADPSTNTNTRSCGNQANNGFATVSGGIANQATGNSSTVGGGNGNDAGDNSATVAGGALNIAGSSYATVSGGGRNNASGQDATVSGGFGNTASGVDGATVSGGETNTASGERSTVGGGVFNIASGTDATIPGGYQNTASGAQSWVGGGMFNVASGDAAAAPGGFNNAASGSNSFAAGANVIADQSLCVVFGLWSSGNAASCHGSANIFKVMGDNGFSVDYHLPVGSGSNSGGDRWLAVGPFTDKFGLVHTTIITWNGAYLSDAGVWVAASSSKSSKTDFDNVDVNAVLKRVLDLPITTWRYKEGEGSIRHMGPMAEDFWDAFHIGYGDKTIADLDARGVEFAAIQGLHKLFQEKDAEIEVQQREIQVMHEELDALKRAVTQLAHWNAAVAAEGTH